MTSGNFASKWPSTISERVLTPDTLAPLIAKIAPDSPRPVTLWLTPADAEALKSAIAVHPLPTPFAFIPVGSGLPVRVSAHAPTGGSIEYSDGHVKRVAMREAARR